MWGARNPVPIRLILLKDAVGKHESIPILSTTLTLTPEAGIEAYVAHWNVDVTFREVREHLGVEAQRQWSDKAIARTIPILFGPYSIVVLLANRLMGVGKVDKQEAAWYSKSDHIFSGLLTAIRKDIWRTRNFCKVGENTDLTKNLPPELLDALAARWLKPHELAKSSERQTCHLADIGILHTELKQLSGHLANVACSVGRHPAAPSCALPVIHS